MVAVVGLLRLVECCVSSLLADLDVFETDLDIVSLLTSVADLRVLLLGVIR